MKDLPHHLKKLNRKVIRSTHREEHYEESLPDLPDWALSAQAKKKQAKLTQTFEKIESIPSPKNPEKRNKEMKGGREGRVPIFDRNNQKPKHAKASKKKAPKL